MVERLLVLGRPEDRGLMERSVMLNASCSMLKLRPQIINILKIKSRNREQIGDAI